jgi:hypothetical protein
MSNEMIHNIINKSLPFAACVVTTLFFAAAAIAQTSPAAGSAAGNTAKPSPYVGVSKPPADDTITVDDEQPAQSAPVVQPTPGAAEPAAAPSRGAAVAVAPPSPELAPDDHNDEDRPTAPVLNSRSSFASNYAGDSIVTYVPGPANALPEGTIFRVSLLQEISAETAVPGTPFRAKLLEDLKHDGRVVVPAGSELHGEITRASTGRRITGSSVIHLRPEEFILPDGTRYRLEAQVIDTQGSDTKASGEGNIVPRSGAQRTLTDLAVTSGGGAIIGASLGGPVGAAVGSAVGAGIETGVWLFQNRTADVSDESTLIFSLTDPMFLVPAHD